MTEMAPEAQERLETYLSDVTRALSRAGFDDAKTMAARDLLANQVFDQVAALDAPPDLETMEAIFQSLETPDLDADLDALLEAQTRQAAAAPDDEADLSSLTDDLDGAPASERRLTFLKPPPGAEWGRDEALADPPLQGTGTSGEEARPSKLDEALAQPQAAPDLPISDVPRSERTAQRRKKLKRVRPRRRSGILSALFGLFGPRYGERKSTRPRDPKPASSGGGLLSWFGLGGRGSRRDLRPSPTFRDRPAEVSTSQTEPFEAAAFGTPGKSPPEALDDWRLGADRPEPVQRAEAPTQDSASPDGPEAVQEPPEPPEPKISWGPRDALHGDDFDAEHAASDGERPQTGDVPPGTHSRSGSHSPAEADASAFTASDPDASVSDTSVSDTSVPDTSVPDTSVDVWAPADSDDRAEKDEDGFRLWPKGSKETEGLVGVRLFPAGQLTADGAPRTSDPDSFRLFPRSSEEAAERAPDRTGEDYDPGDTDVEVVDLPETPERAPLETSLEDSWTRPPPPPEFDDPNEVAEEDTQADNGTPAGIMDRDERPGNEPRRRAGEDGLGSWSPGPRFGDRGDDRPALATWAREDQRQGERLEARARRAFEDTEYEPPTDGLEDFASQAYEPMARDRDYGAALPVAPAAHLETDHPVPSAFGHASLWIGLFTPVAALLVGGLFHVMAGRAFTAWALAYIAGMLITLATGILGARNRLGQRALGWSGVLAVLLLAVIAAVAVIRLL